MERQRDIYSGISYISNLIYDISKYLEILEINDRYQKLFRDVRNWNSNIKKWIIAITKSFRDIINWIFHISNTLTDINNSKILFIYKIIFRDIANSNFKSLNTISDIMNSNLRYR